MAIAFNAITDTEELRAPANPLSTGGNVTFTRSCKIVVPASTTAETLDLPIDLPPGTLVIGAVINTDTTYGATATLSLKTKTAGIVFVAAATQTVVGGEQKTIAANKGVVVPATATADDTVQLILAAAASPNSETTLVITLVCALIGPVNNARTTFTA